MRKSPGVYFNIDGLYLGDLVTVDIDTIEQVRSKNREKKSNIVYGKVEDRVFYITLGKYINNNFRIGDFEVTDGELIPITNTGLKNEMVFSIKDRELSISSNAKD